MDDPSSDVNQIKSIRRVDSAGVLAGLPAVEIELSTNREFTVHDELFILNMGGTAFTVSRYPDTNANAGDTHNLIFTVPASAFDQLPQGTPMAVQYSLWRLDNAWNFGRLDKTIVGK